MREKDGEIDENNRNATINIKLKGLNDNYKSFLL